MPILQKLMGLKSRCFRQKRKYRCAVDFRPECKCIRATISIILNLLKVMIKVIHHALLGIFDPIAGVAAKALSALGAGDLNSYHQAFDPTIALSRHIFRAPTRFYKTGVVFMAYLHGHQNHFTMVAGQECARSTLHLAQIVRLASDAGLFPDPELAAHRAQTVFAVRGVDI